MRKFLACACLVLANAASAADAPIVWLGRFDASSEQIPKPWDVVQLQQSVPLTRYRVRDWDGIAAVEAHADRSMALLARQVTADLTRTPVLCWRWRVAAPLLSADLGTRAGDDYAARVYVAFSLPPAAVGALTRMKLRLARMRFGASVPDAALNYVWDNRHPVGTHAPNAYTDRTHMFVVRSGAQHAEQWVRERRDLLADLHTAFGDTAATLTLIAVAADTDNTGEQAHSGFADLHLVPSDAPCAF